MATKLHLETAGYGNVTGAEDGEQGLAMMRRELPALVLLDRRMPGKDGIQVLEIIKDNFGDDVEVVMLTAYGDKGYITEAMRRGAFHYLVKDEDPELMLYTIENALRYHEKSAHGKAIEQEIYELLINNDVLIKKGYDFNYFKEVLRQKVGNLVDGVIHTTITDCMECENHACQMPLDALFASHSETKTLNTYPGDNLPLNILLKEDNHAFFDQSLNRFIAEEQRSSVRSLVYVPFIERSSSQLLSFFQGNQHVNDFIRYCCLYIFSTKPLMPTPEEKRLLRGFFERFLIAIRMAKLVDKVHALNKDRMLGEMAAMVVHQISPLIAPLIHCLQQPDADKHQKGLEMVKDLRRMVDDFREYANGIVKDYRFEQVDIGWIIHQAETLVTLETNHPIDYRHLFPDEQLHIHGDANRLRQVFSNLLINAAQAIAACGRQNGQIEIELLTGDNHVEVRIKDNGPGVREEIVPVLFHSYLSTKKAGMGLGLFLASEIIRRHGGRIEYNSQYTAGAEFVVKLPLAGNGTL
jgi:signal transduction histidine kinase